MSKPGWLIILIIIQLIYFQSCKNIVGNSDPPVTGVPNPTIASSPYRECQWHPGGEFISFNYLPLEKIEYNEESRSWTQYFNYDSLGFWIICPDGTGKKRIFPYWINSYSWSPDGKWIAFSMNFQIYKMKFTGTTFDTTQLVQLTFEGKNFQPSWSPDGEWIAYDSNVNSERGGYYIWKMRKDGSAKKQLYYKLDIGEVRTPFWSPDFKILHYRVANGHELFLMDSSGRNAVQLTHNEMDEWIAKFNPKGDKIAFNADGKAPDGRVLHGATLWIMDADGSNLKEIIPYNISDGTSSPFSWSPNNNEIVFVKYNPHDWTYENGTLWILNVNTRETRQLTFNKKPQE